jgi:hypothetical protein
MASRQTAGWCRVLPDDSAEHASLVRLGTDRGSEQGQQFCASGEKSGSRREFIQAGMAGPDGRAASFTQAPGCKLELPGNLA